MPQRVEYEIVEYHYDYYEWYIDDDYLINDSVYYDPWQYVDEWFYDTDYKYLSDSNIIDLDSIYPLDIRRERKLDLIFGLEDEKDFKTTIGDFIKNKNENEN